MATAIIRRRAYVSLTAALALPTVPLLAHGGIGAAGALAALVLALAVASLVVAVLATAWVQRRRRKRWPWLLLPLTWLLAFVGLWLLMMFVDDLRL